MDKRESRAARSNPDQELRKKAYRAVADVYNQFATIQERNAAVLYKVAGFIESGVITDTEVALIQSIDADVDKDTWVSAVLLALEPVVQMQASDAEAYEKIHRENTMRLAEAENGSVRLNEIVYYDRDSAGWAHLHIAASVHVKGKLRLMKDALQQLAAVAKEDSEFKGVVGTSWIIGAHERIAQRFGFTVEGEISAEDRERGFAHEDADTSIKRARISREELISRYSA